MIDEFHSYKSSYWKDLGLVEVPDDSIVAQKLSGEDKYRILEIDEKMFEIVPELNKLFKPIGVHVQPLTKEEVVPKIKE